MNLRIFPCKDKRPITPNGLYDAKPLFDWNGDEAEQWGLVAGEEAGFFVVDIDKKHGGLETLSTMKLPATYQWTTQNGGLHVFFKWPSGKTIRNKVGFLPGWDIRGNGGYVVCYAEPEDLLRNEVAEAPDWLLSLITEEDRPKGPSAVASQDEVAEGGRNHFLTALAGRLRRIDGLSLAGLKEMNETRCVPPLPDNEVEAIYNSVMRYNPDLEALAESTDFSQLIWAKSMAGETFRWLSDAATVIGTPTTCADFDALLGGGKRLGELTVTIAQAKSGKNTLWHWLMLPWLESGMYVGYASRELSPEVEVLPNLLTLKLKKNVYKDRSITEAELAEAMDSWKLAFAPGYGIILPKELFQWMDTARAAGVSYFFIDHLHFLLPDPEDYKSVSVFIRELKKYARTHSVHIDLIVQPKNQERGTKLGLDSMRGGSALGQALDNLVAIERQRDSEGALLDIVEVRMEASRSKLAKNGSFYLGYDKESMAFHPVERVEEEPKAGGLFNRPETVFVNGAKVASDIIKRLG